MTGIFLNIFESKFEKDYFELQYLSYEKYTTREAYRKLRTENLDYEFYKCDVKLDNGRTERRIYFWGKKLNPNTTILGTKDRVDIQNNPKIISKIIESCILQQFRNFGKFQIFKKKEEHFWSIVSPSNLFVTEQVEEDIEGNKRKVKRKLVNGILAFNKFHFNTLFNSFNGNLSYYFVLSRSIKLQFEIGKDGFEERRIECRDLKGKDNVIFANKQSIKRFLTATGQQGNYDSRINLLEHNQENFKKIKQVFDWLDAEKEKIFLPSENKFSEFSMKYLPLENDKVQSDRLEDPIRYYFENRTEKGYYNDVISRLKPYSFKFFENQEIKISIICPKFNEGILEGFINKLETRLKSMFHIKPVFSTVFLSDTKIEAYTNALYEEQISSSSLCIVVLTEQHLKIIDLKQSPYFVCKAKLLGQGVPTQDIQEKHLKKLNQFVMNNLALNIYAKIGGIGWTIQNIEKRREELVIGIGSSLNKEGKRILGIAQIFHSDGRYLVGDCSPLSTFDNYAENLENHLYNSLSKIISQEIINKKSEFRLVFHLFKSASKEYEIKAVENVIKKFQNDNLTFKYAFVHLAYGHNFRLFSNDGINNDTVKVFGKEQRVNTTPKGTYVELSKYRSLVHFVPESTIPLEIEIDKRSTFEDLRYISTQVYWFSHLSHRTFLPSKKTVTILYPSIMSGLLDKLREIDDWDKMRAEKITDKLWFI
ncbi:MAG: Piwi domain-containing protein [Chitinophagales bacterium]